jgi:hypothetical protein
VGRILLHVLEEGGHLSSSLRGEGSESAKGR